MNDEVMPWNRAIWEAFAHRREQLPHAMLFCGAPGLGKERLALHLAHLLLCAAPRGEGEPCGVCQGCRLFAAGTHPDLHVLQPEAAARNARTLLACFAARYLPPENKSRKSARLSVVMRIDQVRGMIENVQTRAHIAPRKIVLLTPAESMNTETANSLLKLLEEPPADTFLILVSAQPSRLPPTIRSRCNRIEFAPPARAAALAWLGRSAPQGTDTALLLDLTGGAPLAALQAAQGDFLAQRADLLRDLAGLSARRSDPLGCAARWAKFDVAAVLGWLQGWLMDLVRLRLSPQVPPLFNPDARDQLQVLAETVHLERVFALLDEVAHSRNLLADSPLDELLLLENILVRWTRLTPSEAASHGG